jgi:hypothetical protein
MQLSCITIDPPEFPFNNFNGLDNPKWHEWINYKLPKFTTLRAYNVQHVQRQVNLPVREL